MGVERCRRRTILAASACLAALVAGCAGAASHEKGVRRLVRPRIAEEALLKHGLETLWYSPSDAVDNPVQMVNVEPEGLFIATVPTAERKGRIKLLSLANGTAVWYFEISKALRAPPSVYRYPKGMAGRADEVYFAQHDKVYCLDLRYGAELWSADIPHSISTRVVADDVNYFFGSDNGRAYGYRKKSNLEEWTYRTGDAVLAAPVVLGGSAFFASTDGVTYRLFSATPGWIVGQSWRFKTGARIIANPVVFSRWIFVGSTDYRLYCLESQDGTPFWSFPAEAPIEDPPVVYSYRSNQEYAYVTTVRKTPREETHTLISVKLRDGQEAWRKSGIRKVVSLGKNSLYVLNEATAKEGRFLLALDVQTGEEQFRIPVTGFDFVPHNSADSGRDTVERGKIYLVGKDGTIQVIGEKA